MKIAVLVGSLRKESLNLKMAHALTRLAPKDWTLDLVPIGNLALYNEELDDSPPVEWVRFRDQIRQADGVLFLTPEYNRSIPGVLKNAIDIGSRPYGKSAWQGIPGGVISVSPGSMGGFGANHHLRQCLVFLDVPCLQQPELYIGGASTLFDEQGELQNERTQVLLKSFLSAYGNWVETWSEARRKKRAA